MLSEFYNSILWKNLLILLKIQRKSHYYNNCNIFLIDDCNQTCGLTQFILQYN